MMFTGRILVVSDRSEVVDELAPIIRNAKHLASVVPDGGQAMQVLEEGLVPDVMITDLGCERSFEEIGYMRRFRDLNRAGCHIVVTEPGAPFSGRGMLGDDRFSVMQRPFDAETVRVQIDEAVSRVEREISALRSETWRSIDRLRREVSDARAEMIQALALTIAARDRYMYGHCQRVADMCDKMAIVLKLSDEKRRLLESAAQLHEIGKISVPIELLQKTEPLNPEELQTIRAHASVGAEIVRGVPSLRALAPLIEHQGTNHEELCAQVPPTAPEHLLIAVLRVVDAWDAMTSERSYRGAMPREYWEPFLKSGAGTRFHPAVVSALFRVLGEDETDG